MEWRIKENEEQLCPDLVQDDIPHALPTNLHVLRRNGCYYLSAQNIAGVVPFNNGHSVYINPKYKNIDPIELLYYANGCDILDSDEQASQYKQGDGQIDFGALNRMFVAELVALQRYPMKFSRLPSRYIGKAAKGRIDWVRTDRVHSQGKAELFIGTTSSATTIIPENAVIALAARRILPMIDPFSDGYKIVQKWSAMPVSEKQADQYIARIQRNLRQQQFGGAHGFLYRAVVLAQVILGYGGLIGGQDYADNAMLFNMPALYEDAVRTAFQRVVGPLGLSCQKGFTPRSYLFSSGDCEIIPDIAIYNGVTISSILDVKYKTPDSKDYYQVYTYMAYAGLNTAHIISPAVKDGAVMVAYDGRVIQLHKADCSSPQVLEAMAHSIVKSVI